MKKKRKLNLDDLEIESFATTVASEVVGGQNESLAQIAASCYGTCYATCGASCVCSVTGEPCLIC